MFLVDYKLLDKSGFEGGDGGGIFASVSEPRFEPRRGAIK